MYPSKEIVIKVLENEYKVNWPNSGQLIDIQVMRMRLTDGQYMSFELNSFEPMIRRAKDVADMVSTFGVLVPNLKKDLNVASILDLDHEKTDILLKVYREQYLPWYVQWAQILSNPTEAVEAEEKSK